MKKRLLSWLLVLTMVISMIPGTLVTASAAEVRGDGTEITYWPTQTEFEGKKIITIQASSDITPTNTLTIGRGMRISVTGNGALKGATMSDKAPLFIVEEGGHLVLDGVTITGNTVAEKGAVYVQSGGLLDLGYNEKRVRTAPSITGNTNSGSPRNLVIEDGATVRLNAEATREIGVSYAKDVVQPVALIEGGRYALKDSDLTCVKVDDATTKKLSVSIKYDNIVVHAEKINVLNWSMTNGYSWVVHESNPRRGTYLSNCPGMAGNVFVKNASANVVAKFGTKNSRAGISASDNILQYDLIIVEAPTQQLTANELQMFKEYINYGGRILLLGEDVDVTNQINTPASQIAQSLGADFTITKTGSFPWPSWNTGGQQNGAKTYVYESSLTAGISPGFQTNAMNLNASPTTVQANKGQANSIEIPTFDGYTASTYTYKDGSNTTVTNSGVGSGISITPAEDTGTVTITYTRTDGSVVLPGKDTKIDAPDHDKDNVTVKPDGNSSITGPDNSGDVTVSGDDGATVTRPTDPTNPDNGKDNIKVPDGTVIKPDGTIVLPDNGGEIGPDKTLPDNTPTGYVTVTYKANGGVGEDVKQVVKAGEAKAMANPFTGHNGATFTGWNTTENGVGGTAYATNASITIPTGDKGITLYAQWNGATYINSATITYKPNGATANDVVDTVGSNTQTTFSVALRTNPFALTSWNFGGWNEVANGSGTLHQASGAYTLNKDDAKNLYAQWYRVNNDGSITVPGADGNPTTEDNNVTANGNGTQNPTRDDATGNIEIPAGGSVTVGDKTIVVPDGAILKPDGTLEINKPDSNNNGNADDGKIEISLPNGTPTSKDDTGNADNKTVVTLTYQINNGENDEVKVYAVSGEKVKAIANPFTWDNNHIFLNWMEEGANPAKEYAVGAEITVGNADTNLHAQWAKKNADGSVELPGKDGILEGNNGEEKDNVLVKPDGDNGNITPQPDGSVKVEDNKGGTVTRPDPDDNTGDTKEDVKVPEGTIVKPDGTIILPDNTTINPDDKLPDDLNSATYVVVTYEPNGGTGDVIQQVVKKDEAIRVLGADAFTAPAGKYFGKWTDGNAEYTANEELVPTQNVTLTAQWEQYGPAIRYTATVTFHDNTDGNNTATQTFGSVDSSSITAALNANAFTAPTGWSFMGWSTSQNGTADGTFYKNQASVTLNDGDTLDLYAIWYKQDGNNIVLPGEDGKAGTADDLTVKPGANGQNPTVKNDNGEGYVEAPTGSEIVKTPGDGSNTIKVITGPVNVYPDGTVKVPEGSKIELPDGTVVEGPATVDPDNTVDKDTDTGKPKRDNDGNIILPGKDGKMDAPNDQDNVKVTPDKDDNGTDNSTIDDATGKVTLPDGGKVKYPDAPNGNGSTVDAPDGSIVWPDGTIEFPNTDEAGSITDSNGNVKPIPGGSTVDKDGVVTYRYTIKFSGVSRADEYVMVKAGVSKTFAAPHFNGYTVDKQSATWNGGDEPFTVTFTYTQGSTTPPSSGGGGVTTYTITASAGNGGSISPSGKVSVNSGNDKAFTITADNGYRIKDVLVDGKSVGAVAFYSFEKVRTNHTISVVFEAAKPANGEVADPDETGVSSWLRVTDHSAYMNGYGTGKFGPNDMLTRAQAAQLFYNLLVNKNVEITVSFTDVPEDSWCATAVNTLASLGIVNGIGYGMFDPNSNITRGQFAAIATRFAKAVSGVTESPFSDVSSSDWYFSSVVTAVSYGWIQGYSNGAFGPQDDVTRAQAATIVNRMLARSADRDFINDNANVRTFDDVTENDWFYYQVLEAANSHNHGYSSDGYEIWTGIKK